MIYAMATRMGSVVIKKRADNLEEAIDYFSKLKQLPKKEFLKLFIVTEVK
tara:strand:+ start:2626 stop:2775 length:150 start_codon:yes stop_codon:yes gene_type:complete